jgi:hypothetical protein
MTTTNESSNPAQPLGLASTEWLGLVPERAWLVEWKAHGYGPQWWGFNHAPGKHATWCSDANNAIRFARKEDAERMRLHVIAVAGLTGHHEYERSITATEHEWPNAELSGPGRR